MKIPIKIRGHHISCPPRFYHGGYDKTFAENMKKIVMYIRKNPDVKIKLLSGKPDSLCEKCPNLYKQECVQSPEIGRWVVMQDKKVLKYMKFKPNTIHTAREIYTMSMEKINPKTIRKVCKGCIFLDNCVKIGINQSFRKDLLNHAKK